MAANLVDEIAAKAATLPPDRQREVLRMVEALAEQSASAQTDDAYTLPPLVTDKEERARGLRELVEEMKSKPLMGNPPRLTREELHERG